VAVEFPLLPGRVSQGQGPDLSEFQRWHVQAVSYKFVT
jgi:hypothetical protein